MVLGGSNWFSVVIIVFKWLGLGFSVIVNGSEWFSLLLSSSQWFSVVFNGFEQFSVVLSDYE